MIPGKSTAIAEAVLFALEQNYSRITINTTIKGHFQWVKAHRGTEGNETNRPIGKAGRRNGRSARRQRIQGSTTDGSHRQSHHQQLEAATHNAAAQTFKVHPYMKRTPWIREETLTALTEVRNAEAALDHNAKA